MNTCATTLIVNPSTEINVLIELPIKFLLPLIHPYSNGTNCLPSVILNTMALPCAPLNSIMIRLITIVNYVSY
ncbi:unnamed protein product [Urochloa humidicola]